MPPTAVERRRLAERPALPARREGQDRQRLRDPAEERPAPRQARHRGRQRHRRASRTSTAAATRRSKDRGYDCSGSVSYALIGGDLLKSPLDSGSFMSWGRKGKGKWITVYAQRRPRLRGDRRAPARHRLARPERRPLRPGARHRPALEQDDARPVRLPGPPPRRLLAPARCLGIVPGRNGRSRGLPGQDRRAEGDHRDGAPVRRQGDPPDTPRSTTTRTSSPSRSSSR